MSDYNHIGKTKNYLYTIAGNLCKDHFKKTKEIPVEESELNTQVEAVEQPMEQVLNKLTVEWALKQLPNELSEVITLYYFQDLKITEIADILHISVPLVKYRLKQAKVQLEKMFGKEGIYESGGTTYDL